MKKLIFILSIGMGNEATVAQENVFTEPLITDRPDATESPTAITKGMLQIETGSFYESYEENSIKRETFTYNTTLLRYGIIRNLELRVGCNFAEESIGSNANQFKDISSGFHPLLVGFKTTIVQANGWIPEIGFLGHLHLPFMASTDYKPETTGADVTFAFNHTLNDKSSIGYNIGAAWKHDSPEIAYIYTIAYGFEITNQFGVYTELYGDIQEHHIANHFWDAGLTYLISDNLQLDASVGSSITKGQDILLSAGASYRIPTKKHTK
ncbi:outer membrane putative beta-barrel porin/alpha-amylase [Gelidibacter sediminis]|uniref:Outer membrane putative beta-barrel porin/alpha-amylase n=1 Tax=Gelidibacter sediminis TaxID=1608710 RepID=A0A4V3F9B8_9FLAO|nr:transporter [Gelidibacter sediminis]TDU43636.1 outer membrane putative beta-barrel porin/alpha-amylase [Gelidibacter sediminis]